LIRLPFVCDDSGVDEADDIADADADDAALGQWVAGGKVDRVDGSSR